MWNLLFDLYSWSFSKLSLICDFCQTAVCWLVLKTLDPQALQTMMNTPWCGISVRRRRRRPQGHWRETKPSWGMTKRWRNSSKSSTLTTSVCQDCHHTGILNFYCFRLHHLIIWDLKKKKKKLDVTLHHKCMHKNNNFVWHFIVVQSNLINSYFIALHTRWCKFQSLVVLFVCSELAGPRANSAWAGGGGDRDAAPQAKVLLLWPECRLQRPSSAQPALRTGTQPNEGRKGFSHNVLQSHSTKAVMVGNYVLKDHMWSNFWGHWCIDCYEHV